MTPENPADRAIRFLGRLKGWEGSAAGQPIKLLPFQTDEIIRPLIGKLTPERRRQYREALLFLPRGSGKTSLVAMLATYFLFCSRDSQDQPKQTSIIIAAKVFKQSKVLFNGVVATIMQDPYLKSITHIKPSERWIQNLKTGSTLEVFSQDSGAAYGQHPEILLFDEIFTWPNDDLYVALTSGFKGREEPLIINITTAGIDISKEHWAFQKYQYAKKVKADPTIDPTFLPVLYELDPKDDWQLEANWFKASPALGHFLSLDNMRAELAKAKNSPREELKFRTLYLNQWSTSEGGGFPLKFWYKAPKAFLDDFTDRASYGGMDVAATRDLTALTLVFPSEKDGRWYYDLKTWYWLPEFRIKSRADCGVNFKAWRDRGLLEVCGKDAIDQPALAKRVVEICKAYNCEFVAYDPYNARGIPQMVKDEVRIQEFPQIPKYYNSPMKQFEIATIEGRIAYGDNPITRWCAENLIYRYDTNANVTPDKGKSREARIDGMVSAFMAYAMALKHTQNWLPEA